MNNQLSINRFPFRTGNSTLGELHQKITKGYIKLDSVKVKCGTQFIEACLLHIPAQAVYLAEKTDGLYVVVDGLQRLAALKDFINGSLKLTSVVPELCGRTIRDLNVKEEFNFYSIYITTHIAEGLLDEALVKIYVSLNH